MDDSGLRRGDLVEVRSPAEILRTLDSRGRLNEMPFMSEMVNYCGRRFTVDKRADKVCDTITTLRSRRIVDSVLLDDLRCDGTGHGGCQAECRLYWNAAWLKRVRADDPPGSEEDGHAKAELLRLAAQSAATTDETGSTRYWCQATEMVAASEDLSTMAPGPYLNELRTGNVTLRTFARVMARAVVVQPLHRANLLRVVPVRGDSTSSPETELLNLQPGEWVRVKSRDEIAKTLTDKGRNRGLWFDREMVPFCGGVYRVRQRVTRVIDEHSGHMVELSRDCIMLDGVVCSGERSTSRWFCPRAIPSYWRECWLERAEDPRGG